MRVGIIGLGVVGRATARCFMESCEVLAYDPAGSPHQLVDALSADITFVCVPEGQLDTLFATLRGSAAMFTLKSTVPIGTTERLVSEYGVDVAHCPEFLTARRAATDAQLPARSVAGGSGRALEVLVSLLLKRFPGVPVHIMGSRESEAVKLICNAFFAVKVSFFNEANAMCEEWGLRWDAVLGAVLADGRIAHAHTSVPGPDGRFGFGGACLPKDAAMFAEAAGPGVTSAALARNSKDRQR